MQEVIILNQPQIRLSDKFFNYTFEGKNGEQSIEIDLQTLFRSSSESEDAWINVTPLLRIKGYTSIGKWLRVGNTEEYAVKRSEAFKIKKLGYSKPAHSYQLELTDKPTVKLPYRQSQWYSKGAFEDNPTPLIITRRGQHHSGTWLHKELFMEFISILDVDFRIELHDMVMNIIKTAHVMVVTREETKRLFHPLTDAIKDIYIPAQTNPNSKKWAYPDIADLCNKFAIGMTSKTYRETVLKISKDEVKQDGKISIRDWMTKTELNKIEAIEKDVWGFMTYAGITDKNEIEAKLNKMHNRGV